MSLRTPQHAPGRDRHNPGSLSRRPAVVETDSPQSSSDGRATSPSRELPRRTLGSQVRTFAAIGVVSTAAWALIYWLLRGALTPLLANGVALVVTAIGNTAANRRLTFGVRGRHSLVRDHASGLGAFLIAIVLTSGAAVALDGLAPHAGRLLELAILAVANVIATAARFVLLRAWVGRASETGQAIPSRHDFTRIPS